MHVGGFIIAPSPLPQLADELRVAGGMVFVGELSGDASFHSQTIREIRPDVFLRQDLYTARYNVVDALGAALGTTVDVVGRYGDQLITDAGGEPREDLQASPTSMPASMVLPAAGERRVLFVEQTSFMRWNAALIDSSAVDGFGTQDHAPVALDTLRL